MNNELRPAQEKLTSIVKSFYEKTPFPNYEDCENINDLIRKAQASTFYELLNEQLPFGINVLEVGCGTGQLSNYLGIAHRYICASDICFNSLKLGNEFKKRNALDRINFFQMDLFNPVFKEESFHVVICNGVLHHTGDPFLGFQSVAKLVRKGGYIIIGLYNKYGRLATDIRRVIFNLSGDRFKFLDPRLREDIGGLKKQAWFLDQYKHPHESKHTFKEVLGWFSRTGFEYINSIPKLKSFVSLTRDERLFEPSGIGNCLDRFLSQAYLAFKGDKDGGFFLVIGKRVN